MGVTLGLQTVAPQTEFFENNLLRKVFQVKHQCKKSGQSLFVKREPEILFVQIA
jgi:hypothetical protein